jgi:hypothetical protein
VHQLYLQASCFGRLSLADLAVGNAIQVLNVQSHQIGHIPKTTAAWLARYMDNRTLLVEAHLISEKGFYDCPIQLKFYGTNDPVERQTLLNRLRADGLLREDPAERERERQRERREAAAEKERQRIAKKVAKQAKNKGSVVVVDLTGQDIEPGMAEFAAASSQDTLTGPSLADILGGSVRYNPRPVEEVVEDFGVKESDLVSQLPAMIVRMLMTHRPPCHRPSNLTRSSLSFIHFNYKALNGCLTRKALCFRPRAQGTLSSSGNVIHRCPMHSRMLRPISRSPTQHWHQVAFSQMTWGWEKPFRPSR